jgi:hypothetical protein
VGIWVCCKEWFVNKQKATNQNEQEDKCWVGRPGRGPDGHAGSLKRCPRLFFWLNILSINQEDKIQITLRLAILAK